MKKPFVVGERVKIYFSFSHVVSGLIKKIEPDGILDIRKDDLSSVYAHPKQCRRLVKKKRIRIWVNFYECNGLAQTAHHSQFQAEHTAKLGNEKLIRTIEFIEVKKK